MKELLLDSGKTSKKLSTYVLTYLEATREGKALTLPKNYLRKAFDK